MYSYLCTAVFRGLYFKVEIEASKFGDYSHHSLGMLDCTLTVQFVIYKCSLIVAIVLRYQISCRVFISSVTKLPL